MITNKNPRGAGRKPTPPALKKNPLNIKLEQYLIDWLDSQPESKAVLIAEAMHHTFYIKKPE
jgi:hypothetical protein